MTEQDIVKILSNESEEFRKLGDEHQSLESMLTGFTERAYLTPEEEVEKKRIQKLKLVKKDRMAELVRGYKKTHYAN
ncbi:MAG: DUF465 domain-containing protein [Thermodesulfovibrionales bacterium]|nr:DUF465 domain-containing protein [Thermodesulfovibrionales bacterium]